MTTTTPEGAGEFPPLKPCPFCGAQPSMPEGGPGVWRQHFVVKCGTTSCYGNPTARQTYASAAAAIAAWNRRAQAAEGGKETMVDMVPPATARDRWMYNEGRKAERDPRTPGTRAALIEECCARIKAADDAMADCDYMLDSNDCISVLRGTWTAPLANDCPTRRTTTEAAEGEPSAPEAAPAPTIANALGAFAIEVEKLLCKKLGIDWSPASISIVSLIDRLAAPAPASEAVALELRGVAETLENGDGFWRPCSGCHELNEGYDTGPYSEALKCHLGGGCSECGGIGAVWDATDYEAMVAAPTGSESGDAAVLQGVDGLLREAYAHWDADREFKVGKILLALIGFNKGYDKRADAWRAALQGVKPQEGASHG